MINDTSKIQKELSTDYYKVITPHGEFSISDYIDFFYNDGELRVLKDSGLRLNFQNVNNGLDFTEDGNYKCDIEIQPIYPEYDSYFYEHRDLVQSTPAIKMTLFFSKEVGEENGDMVLNVSDVSFFIPSVDYKDIRLKLKETKNMDLKKINQEKIENALSVGNSQNDENKVMRVLHIDLLKGYTETSEEFKEEFLKVYSKKEYITDYDMLNKPYINPEILERYVSEGYISKRKHPYLSLYVYKYTPLTTIERKWDDVTKKCRGLILDSEYRLVSKPFDKFFNYQELKEGVPNTPYVLREKMDGSLGISYMHEGVFGIATCGSFDSEQALFATKIIKDKYSKELKYMDFEKYTYLFEIIYPENRVVLDYGQIRDVYFLGAIEKQKNTYVKHFPYVDLGFPTPESIDFMTVEEALDQDLEGKEGYVVYHSCGTMYKIKFKKYLELHRLLTQFTNKDLWKMMKEGNYLDYIADIPDEYYQSIKEEVSKFLKEYNSIENDCNIIVDSLQSLDRKTIADRIKEYQYKNVVFLMLDGKDFSESIWKHLKPETSKTFFHFNREFENGRKSV